MTDTQEMQPDTEECVQHPGVPAAVVLTGSVLERTYQLCLACFEDTQLLMERFPGLYRFPSRYETQESENQTWVH